MNQPNPQFGSASTPGRSVQFKVGGPIAQILSLLILLALIVVGFIIFIPLAIIIIVLALILFAYFKIKRAFSKSHAPNGPLDGRRNVRVMDRDE
jgi:4-hydroxybenzoate polyprenyltransferase